MEHMTDTAKPAVAPHAGSARHPQPAAGARAGRAAFDQAFADPGQAADPLVRAPVEAAAGRSLAHVRVHTGPRVRTAARAAGAAAFTIGPDIGVAVGPGQAIPERLLRHELIHAAQQSGRGQTPPGAAEAQARHGADQPGALPALAATGAPYVAFAPEDWLQSTPDVRSYGITELADELRAVSEWLDRQTAGTQQTDRMAEAKAALEGEIARRGRAIQAAGKPQPRRRGRAKAAAAQPGQAGQADVPEQTEMPRVLRDRASTQLTDPAEIRTEVDRIVAWLQHPDVSPADRTILRQELAALEPALGAELNRASAQRQQNRLAQAFSPAAGADRTAVLENIRLVESIRPYQERPGMAYVMHNGEMLVFPAELGDRVRSEVTASLAEAARRATNMNDSTKYRMSEHLRLNYEDQYIVGFAVSVVSGEEPYEVEQHMLAPMRESNMALGRYRGAQQGGSLTAMADAVFTAVEKAGEAQTIVLKGIERADSAAGSIVTGLTITRDLSFAIALSIGAILAAPVVAAGVAGLGATGLVATGLTAGGTGLVVGGGGFLMGFAGGAGGELAAGHGGDAALRAGWSEGKRVGAQGAAIGVGGGASFQLARNLGVGAAGLSRGSQLVRGALAGGGGNALGSMTGAALSDVPEGQSRAGFVLRSGLWGAGTGAFGGAAGAASQWVGSPALRFAVGQGLPSVAGAGATYLQTGDLGQAVQGGALSLTVGALGSMQQAEPTVAQRRAFELGRQVRTTSRAYLAAAMLGTANVGPSLRMGQSPTSITLTNPSEQVTQGQPGPAPAPAAQQATQTEPAPTPAPAPAGQQVTSPAPPAQQQQAPGIRISAGAFVADPARQVTDPFSGEVLGQRSASAQTARSVITGPRADEAEAAGWRGALSRGEIGLQAPLGANVSGGDFYTAEIDANGQVTLIATDVKSSSVGKFPKPASGPPKATWMAELQAAIDPQRLSLGDPALENAIRAAFAAGRVRLRQINADYSPSGGGNITRY